MNRRLFLQRTATTMACVSGLPHLLRAAPGLANDGSVMTVDGPVPPEKLGLTLPHEHVLVDFIGADKIQPGRYSADEAFNRILPHLKEARDLGCASLVECTPAWLGRDPLLLRRLARAVSLHLLTNTGYYGAADNKFLPPHAYFESADQLARRWIREWVDGIDDTGVRPGFIKIGVGGQALSPLHRKLVRAAGRTHRATGLTIASHTGPANLAEEQLAALREEGVSAAAFIWVHAQAEPDLNRCLQVAETGCWVSYDGFSPADTTRYVEVIERFRKAGRLGQLLLSHDAGWFKPGEPNGGEFRPFSDLFKVLFPKLREQEAGGPNQSGESVIKQLMVDNPARAFVQRQR